MDAREEPKVPTWVTRVSGQDGEHAVWYLMNKQIFSSDTCNQQNHFLIGKHVISKRLLPAMSDAEKQAASFLNHPEMGRRRRPLDRLPGGQRRQRLVGRNHGRLNVMAYGQRGLGCPPFLARWTATVLQEPNYGALRCHCFMEIGDEVEIWAFRDEDKKRCFAVANRTVSSFLSLQLWKQSIPALILMLICYAHISNKFQCAC